MRKYQVISIDHEMIAKDIVDNKVTPHQIYQKGQKFLDSLTNTEFEVFESTKTFNSLPTQLLVGGEEALPIKNKVYELAILAGMGNYVGNGEFYTQISKK